MYFAGGLENVDPNPQERLRTSNIPSPVQQSTARASLPVPSLYQAVHHPTSPHPLVDAADIARPSQTPGPPERAPPSADVSRPSAAAPSLLPLPSFAASQVTSDAVRTQKSTAVLAQPAPSGKLASEVKGSLSLPKSLLAPASGSGAAANHEGTVSTAQAPACNAPFQASTSAQINMTASATTVDETAYKSQSGELSAVAAAAAMCKAPAACNGKVLPVPRTMAEVTDSVTKVSAPPAHAAISPVAKRTRAASSQQGLSSPPKSVTNPPSSAMPALFSAHSDSAACEDSDSSSDDDIDSPNNGAAAVSQRPSGMLVNNAKSAPIMLANPL